MTLMQQARCEVLRPTERRSEKAATGLERLRQHVDRAVLSAIGGDHDVMVSKVVAAAIEAFLSNGGDARRAATSVTPLIRQLGEHQAHRGFTNNDLVAAFAAARVTAQKRLQSATGGTLPGDLLVRLRQDLMAYLSMLFTVAAEALAAANALHALSPEERSRRIAAAIFEQTPTPGLAYMAQINGIEPGELFVAVVSTSGCLPTELLQQPAAIAQTSTEILLPAAFDLGRALDSEGVQVVTGHPAALTESAESLTLARRAAALLAAGVVTDPRRVVPCMDLLGALVIESNPLLAELTARKHLSALESAPVQRRVSLGEMCLHWLERGLPMNRLARELGIPPQTAHSRMKALRSMFGDALDDPSQRMELIVALRAALPRWRAER